MISSNSSSPVPRRVSFPNHVVKNRRKNSAASVPPLSSLQDRLLDAVSEVLDIDRHDIPLDDSFTDLGGDQRAARNLRRSCLLQGIDIKTRDVLRCHTLAELQTCIRPATDSIYSSSPESSSLSQLQSSSIGDDSTLPGDTFAGGKTALRRTRSKKQQVYEMESEILSHGAVENAAIIRPRAGYFDGETVAFLTLNAFPAEGEHGREVSMLAEEHMGFAGAQVGLIRQWIEDSGHYDIHPRAWIALEYMPVVQATGKLDRRRLQTWLQNLNEEMYEQVMMADEQEAVVQPANEREHRIQCRISVALKIPEAKIGMNFSFRQLGGDSITASQVAADCRADCILLKQEDILRSNTISEMALLAHSREDSAPSWNEDGLESFSLSPMQQLYFQTTVGGSAELRSRMDGTYRFNQSFLLKINVPTKLDEVKATVEAVVGHHSMLRSRFNHGQGGWSQKILLDVADSYRFGHHTISENSELEAILERSQTIIDIQSGPVFAAEHFYTDDGQQMLYLIAHHLVVDLWSWRVIIKDLDELLHQGTLYSKRSMPFQSWIAIQEEEMETLGSGILLPFQVAPGDHAYWGLEHADNTYQDAAEVGFRLDSEITSILQTTCNTVFGTETVEIYLAALMLSFSQTFHDRPVPVIWNQEPGRESSNPSADIGETVGWFTTLCPVAAAVEGTGQDVLGVLRRTKDMRRSIPDRGRGYFTAQMCDRTLGRFAMPWPFEIMFTYAGSTSQLEPGAEGVLEHQSLPWKTLAPGTSDIGPAVGRIALFEISVMVDKGSAKVKFVYNKQAHFQHRIKTWIQNYQHLLLETIGRLRYHNPELTLCDIHLQASYNELQRINSDTVASLNLKNVKDIEDVLEVTAVQQDLLVRQQACSDSGLVSAVYELEQTLTSDLDVSRICAAWQAIVGRVPALRTVFADSATDRALLDAVVLKRITADMLFVDCREHSDPVAVLERLPRLKNTPGEPRHRLSVCRMAGKAVLKLDISAAICDATSVKLLFSELHRLYISTEIIPPHALVSTDPTIFSQSQYLSALSIARCRPGLLSPFRSMLMNAPACIFPSLAYHHNSNVQLVSLYLPSPTPEQVQNFATFSSFSPETVLRLAWALTLRSFTGQDKVTFGYRASGRSLDVHGIDKAFGSFDTVLPCVADLSGYKALSAASRSIHDYEVQNDTGCILSMSEILHSSRSTDYPSHQWGDHGRLFNTILLFDNEDGAKRRPAPATIHAPNGVKLTAVMSRETFDTDLVLKVRFVGGKTHLDISHRIMTVQQAAQVAGSFAAAINAIIGGLIETVGGVDLFTDADMATIVSWESGTHHNRPALMHDLIVEKCRKQSRRVAVTGWDGEFTYQQLDELSGRVAGGLVALGAKPGTPIPIIFGKSVWAVVGVLGILRSGASFVPFDADEPVSVSRMVRTLGVTIITCSQEFRDKIDPPQGVRVMVVDEATASGLPPADFTKPRVTPSDPAFILASLASPREARGLVYSHAASTAAFLSQGPALGLNSSSRVMQLCAFGVDIAIAEILTTLLAGGTVCVPSSRERTADFSGAVERMGVSFSYLTPVLARRVVHSSLESLKTVCFRTRSLDEETLKPWVDAGIKVFLAYGTPDVCPLGISVLEVDCPRKLRLVGRPSVGRFWIVAKDDPRRLVPVGAIGDLVVDTPTLSTRFTLNKDDRSLHQRNHSRALTSLDMGRGQAPVPTEGSLNRSATTSTMDSKDSNTSGVCPGSAELQKGDIKIRYFRTGHSARFVEGGKVELLDTGDSAIINGQKVVLGDIEAGMRKCFGRGVDVAVQAFAFVTARNQAPSGAQSASETNESLVAFIELGAQFEGSEDLSQVTAKTRSRLAIAKKLVSAALVSSQVPEIFIPIKKIPVTPSLKVNRRKLQRMIMDMSKAQLLALSRPSEWPETGAANLKPLPMTANEEHVRQLWGRVLSLPARKMGTQDTFMRLGGDEFLAADLVITARREGLDIPLVDLLSHRSLGEVARACTLKGTNIASTHPVETEKSETSDKEHSPLSSPSLLPTPDFVSSVLAPAVGADSPLEVKDCALATTSQIWALEDAMLSDHSNIDWLSLNFSGPVSTKSLEEACSLLATIHPILRTGFVVDSRNVWQVVLRSWTPEFKVAHAGWRVSNVVEKLLRRDREQREHEPVDFARPITKFVLVDAGKTAVLLVRLSKAQYDSASLDILLSDLKSLYIGTSNPPKRPGFCQYMRGVQTSELALDSRGYWSNLLDGASMTQVVAHDSPILPTSTTVLRQRIPVGSLAALGLGFDTVVKSAWAMVLGTLAASGDVVFGDQVEGRIGPAGQWSSVVGPCSNAVPVRVRFGDDKMSALDLMHALHAQRESTIPHEGSGWMNILENSTKWPYWTSFGSIVSVNTSSSMSFGDTVDFDLDVGSNTKGRMRLLPGSEWLHADLVVRASLQKAFASVQVFYADTRIPYELASKALSNLCSTIARLTSGPIMTPMVPSRHELESLGPEVPLVPTLVNNRIKAKSPAPSPAPHTPELSKSTPPTGVAALASLATSVVSAAVAANVVSSTRSLPPQPGNLTHFPSISSMASQSTSQGNAPPRQQVKSAMTPGLFAAQRLPPETAIALQSLIMSAWTAILDPRRFGVPEEHMHTAAFYDLWGSLLPAAAMARYLTTELPKMEIPLDCSSQSTTTHTRKSGEWRGMGHTPRIMKVQNGVIEITMDEIVAHPSVLSQLDLLADKIGVNVEGEKKVKQKGSLVIRGMRRLGIGSHLTVNTDIGGSSSINTAVRGSPGGEIMSPISGFPTLLTVPEKNVTISAPPSGIYSQLSGSNSGGAAQILSPSVGTIMTASNNNCVSPLTPSTLEVSPLSPDQEPTSSKAIQLARADMPTSVFASRKAVAPVPSIQTQHQYRQSQIQTRSKTPPARMDSPTMPTFPKLKPLPSVTESDAGPAGRTSASTPVSPASGSGYGVPPQTHRRAYSQPRQTLQLAVPNSPPFLPMDIISPLSPLPMEDPDSMESLTTGSSADSDAEVAPSTQHYRVGSSNASIPMAIAPKTPNRALSQQQQEVHLVSP
ncbi:Nonribosomal peptide synthase atnA [Zalerion maritima]|uniref:Nonribosomal peptide synthase atnA n=1 Tax=Zalerion maritima TaxID=339359 RepID=A0AAD5WW77_9PEZI|nr:Nonribosomal peptide synthase atnA [Zalerion maritima]